MTETRQRLALTAGLTVLVASAVASAATLGPAARRMPLVVALPTLALLVFELIRQARLPPEDVATNGREEAVTLAWLGGLVTGVWLLGMLAALPLFLMSYLRMRSRESWAVALGMASAVWVLLFVVLDRLLSIQMSGGLLGSLIGWGP